MNTLLAWAEKNHTLVTFFTRRKWPAPMTLRLVFDVRDLWIGLFWHREFRDEQPYRITTWHIFIVIVPSLPFHLMWYTRAIHHPIILVDRARKIPDAHRRRLS